MSLLNDALRDLEKRQAEQRPQNSVEVLAYGELTAVDASGRRRWVIVFIVCGLLVGLAVWGMTMKSSLLTPAGDQTIVDEQEISPPVVETKPLPDISTPVEPVVVVTKATDEAPVEKAPAEFKTKPITPDVSAAVVAAAHTDARETPKPLPVPSPPAKPALSPKPAPSPKPIVYPEPVSLAAPVKASPSVQPHVSPKVVADHPDSPEPDTAPANTPKAAPRLVKQTVLTPEQKDVQQANSVRQLFLQGKQEEGRRQLYAYIQANEIDTKSRLLLVENLMSAQRYDESMDLLMATDWRHDMRLRESKARLHVQKGEIDAAIETLAVSLPSVDASPEYHALLAGLYQQQGMADEAIIRYAALVESNNAVADWWAGLAISLEQSGQYNGAERAYQQALSLDGLHPALARYSRERLNDYRHVSTQ